MKKRSFWGKVLGVAALVGMVVPGIVYAETVGDNSMSSNGYPTIVRMENEAFPVNSIDVEWGSLEYEYYHNVQGWVPTFDSNINKASNYVRVTNRSQDSEMQVLVDFNPYVENLTGVFQSDLLRGGYGSCEVANELIENSKVWSDSGINGQYRPYEDATRSYLIFSDANCQNGIATGAAYNSNNVYYYVELTPVSSIYNSTVLILHSAKIPSQFNNIVGGQYNGNAYVPDTGETWIYETAEFRLGLSGGEYDDILSAFNSQRKEIGVIGLVIIRGD